MGRRTNQSHCDTLGDTHGEAHHLSDIHPECMNGLELCEVFYRAQVGPLICSWPFRSQAWRD